ncbi:hypothetical protein JKF63_03373 [Porcisia hertigi]|uniref:Protein kinase domain-containing protein n=1 Tax=Porcisia hertigi TaxID=2761500 RepID=A0A836L7Q8_9TRYP|nr:hypothetical protein JKF63_03373 [Porcisia hertigi]
MQVNSLLERMRKVRQEKAAAAAAAAAATTASAPPTAINSAAIVPTANAAGRDAPVLSATDADTAGGGSAATSSSLPASTAVPTPPPVFASPSSARLEYRDNVGDPLCVPFTSDMFVSVLQTLLSDHQRSPISTTAAAAEASEGFNGDVAPAIGEVVGGIAENGCGSHDVHVSSNVAAGSSGADCGGSVKDSQVLVVEKAVARMREVLAAQRLTQTSNRTTIDKRSCPIVTGTTTTTTSSSNTSIFASSASLFSDIAYNKACAVAHVDVSGSVRPICRDVNYYTRVGRISQGVYGVVFRAVTTADHERQHRRRSHLHTAQQGSEASPKASLPAHVRTYALKHIKKMWLEDSQVGLPPYLMREIDLLLRLQHPNIMGALELVLLDPTPVPHRLASPTKSRSSSSSSSSSSESSSGDQRVDGAADGNCPARRVRSTVKDTADKNPAKKARVDSADDSPSHRAKTTSDGQAQTAGEKGSAQDAAVTRPLAAVGAASKAKDVFLVMEYCPYDLGGYMRRYAAVEERRGSDGGNNESHRTTAQVPYFHITPRNAHPQAAENYVARAKSIVYQLFRAVAFLHDSRILHRDLKTSNVLLSEDGCVKVCDFGLGRLYREGQALTPTVVTLMYRAPELHFGVVDYSHKMDVWSAGCIFAELFLRRPLFHASTDSQHLLAVCEVLGIPTEESFPGLYHLPQTKTMMQSLPRWNRTSRLASLFQRGAVLPTVAHGDVSVASEGSLMPASGVELLASVLQWNPRRRLSAAEVLEHPFFKEEPLPCAPAELMRPMPWLDAAAAAGAAARPTMPLAVPVCEGQRGSLGMQDALPTAAQVAAGSTGRMSSTTVPPAPQYVADIPSGTEANMAAVSSAPEAGIAASPLANATPSAFPGGTCEAVVGGSVGSRYPRAIGTGDYGSSDEDLTEGEREDVQQLQLQTRRSTRDQLDDVNDEEAEKVVR